MSGWPLVWRLAITLVLPPLLILAAVIGLADQWGELAATAFGVTLWAGLTPLLRWLDGRQAFGSWKAFGSRKTVGRRQVSGEGRA